MEAFAKDRPELYKAVLAAIAEADKPGIQATVSEAKAPSSCKYTEEGTMVHELMQNIAKADRRMRAVSALEVTLTAADKEALSRRSSRRRRSSGWTRQITRRRFGEVRRAPAPRAPGVPASFTLPLLPPLPPFVSLRQRILTPVLVPLFSSHRRMTVGF